MKYLVQFFALITLLSCLSCTTTQDQSPQTDWTNPNQEIEELHVQAYNLDTGTGVSQNRFEANKLYLQAAYAGDPRSMMNYAINLVNGQGVEADLVEAYSWLDTARFITQHIPDMKIKWRIRGLYDDLKTYLSPEEIKEGQRRAKIKLSKIQNQ